MFLNCVAEASQKIRRRARRKAVFWNKECWTTVIDNTSLGFSVIICTWRLTGIDPFSGPMRSRAGNWNTHLHRYFQYLFSINTCANTSSCKKSCRGVIFHHSAQQPEDAENAVVAHWSSGRFTAMRAVFYNRVLVASIPRYVN